MAELKIEVGPADQRRAAELAQEMVESDDGQAAGCLAELVDAGSERAIATAIALARLLAATLVERLGAEGALRVLESTRLEAAVAEE